MELFDKIKIEAKNNFALSLQQLMQFEDYIASLEETKNQTYEIISKYNAYYICRLKELMLLSSDGSYFQENLNYSNIKNIDNIVFNDAIDSNGDGADGFYPLPDTEQKINLANSVKYFPSHNYTIDNNYPSVKGKLLSMYNDFESKLFELYFLIETEIYYNEAGPNDPLSTWANWDSVKTDLVSNLTNIRDFINITFRNSINSVYSAIPLDYITYFDFLSSEEKNDVNKLLTIDSLCNNFVSSINDIIDTISNFPSSVKKGNTTTSGTLEYVRYQLEKLLKNVENDSDLLNAVNNRITSLITFQPFNLSSIFWNKFKTFIAYYIDKSQSGVYYTYKNLNVVIDKLFETRDNNLNNLKNLIPPVSSDVEYLPINEFVAITPAIIKNKQENTTPPLFDWGIKLSISFKQIASVTEYKIYVKINKSDNTQETDLPQEYFDGNSGKGKLFTLNITDNNVKMTTKNQYDETVYLPIIKNQLLITELPNNWKNKSSDDEEAMTTKLVDLRFIITIIAEHTSYNLPKIGSIKVNYNNTLYNTGNLTKIYNAEITSNILQIEV